MATNDGRCCCGRPYLPNGGGESDHYCHAGQRNICQECVTVWPKEAGGRCAFTLRARAEVGVSTVRPE